MSIIITLPWPSGALSGHAKGQGWRKVATLTKQERSVAHWLAKQAKVQCWPDAILEFAYHPPKGDQSDVQNMPHRLKGAVDGIADAMGCDDGGFKCRYPDSFSEPRKGGEVVVRVRPNDGSRLIPLAGTVMPDGKVVYS